MAQNELCIPALRFPEFSGEWIKRFLEDGSELISGQHLNPDEYSNGFGETPYFTGPSDFTNYTEKLTKWTLKESKWALQNDVLITVKGNGVGELWFLTLPRVAIGRQLMAIRATSFSSSFLYQYLGPLKEKFFALASGNMIPGLSRYDILRTNLFLPKLAEQQKIAAFLGAVDEKIAGLQKKKDLLEEYKKGCMQKLFSQEIRFTDDNGNRFPNWEEKKLNDLGKFTSGTGFSEVEQGGAEGTPYYKVSDMNLPLNTTVMREANNYVSNEQVNRLNYKPITEEAIIFAKVGAAVFLERKRLARDFLIDNNMMAYIPFKSSMIRFLKIIFERTRLSKYAQVGALPSYNAGDLKTIKVKLPHPEEQKKIADFLSAIDDKIALVSDELGKAKTFKKGLLQQMFV